jgi:hypothetical protein
MRLIQRGLKILAVFMTLNIVRTYVLSDSRLAVTASDPWSLNNLIATYLTGNVYAGANGRSVAFFILIPISYLLLLSAALVVSARSNKYAFHLAFCLLLLCIVGLGLYGLEFANLEYITIGLLGVLLGYIPLQRITAFVTGRPMIVAALYIANVIVVTVWNPIYPVQIISVCINLLLLYLFGVKTNAKGRVGGLIVLLGKYSLFGYIAQIAVLQILYRGLRPLQWGAYQFVFSFIAAFAFTALSVEILNRARGRAVIVDRAYKAVFS